MTKIVSIHGRDPAAMTRLLERDDVSLIPETGRRTDDGEYVVDALVPDDARVGELKSAGYRIHVRDDDVDATAAKRRKDIDWHAADRPRGRPQAHGTDRTIG